MIGMINTNMNHQPYHTTFAHIINQYARTCQPGQLCGPTSVTELIMSVRKDDYEKAGMTLSQMENYIHTCAKFYKNYKYQS